MFSSFLQSNNKAGFLKVMKIMCGVDIYQATPNPLFINTL